MRPHGTPPITRTGRDPSTLTSLRPAIASRSVTRGQAVADAGDIGGLAQFSLAKGSSAE